MMICKLSKILNNKDCEHNTKPSYKENLAHVQRIWNAYKKPRPNLDASLWHIEEYKVSIPDNLHTKLCYCMFSIIFLNFVMVMKCDAKIWRNTQACFVCWINKGVHEYPYVDRCSLLAMAKCLPWMGEVQHPWWIWRCASISTKNDWKIYFRLLGKPQRKTTREIGQGAPFKSNNTQRASSERREA